MADPIRTAAGDRVRYAERDTIGVEHDEPERGINAELLFVRNQYVDQMAEHNGMGVHSTPKIARAKLIVAWDGLRYSLRQRSYLLGEYGAQVATMVFDPLVTGLVTFTLAAGLGTTRYSIADASIDDSTVPSPLAPPDLVRVMRVSVASATTFTVRRFSGPNAPDITPAHGDFTVLIYAE